jgi:Cof subfamily protein (haloacid dehalogenase superfamily)
VSRSGFRLAAIDLDGTLLRSDETVSRRSRSALAAAVGEGLTVVLASARSPRSVAEFADDLGLAGLAVCANGATLYDLDARRILRHTPLALETIRTLVASLRERMPGVAFGWELELRFGSEAAYESLRDPRWPRPEGSFEPCDALAFGRPLTKLLVRHPATGLDDLYAEVVAVAGEDAAVTLAGNAFVELAAPGVSKGAGVAEVAGRLGLDAAAVVAFGDHLTDVPMLDWAGLGVAVANAQPAAIEAADEVTASNDEDGVALVLERLLGAGSAG